MTTDRREGLSPTSVALGHEIGHAVRTRRGAGLPGQTNLMKLTGIGDGQQQLWSLTDEEYVNITQVESKLLKEQGLNGRLFHKDYAESLEVQAFLRLEAYQQTGADEEHVKKILQAIQTKDFAQADQLLQMVRF